MTYPDKFIRGIKNVQQLDKDDSPSISLFMFPDAPDKPDSLYAEISINWVDNEKVVNNLLNERSKKNPEEKLYKVGAAVLSTEEFIKLCSNNNNKRCGLDYERDEKENNPNHGNLLLLASTHKAVKIRLASTIVQNCFLTIEQQNNEEGNI